MHQHPELSPDESGMSRVLLMFQHRAPHFARSRTFGLPTASTISQPVKSIAVHCAFIIALFSRRCRADIPVSFAYIIPMMRYGNAITPEQTSVPKKVFAVMGALDGLSGIMQIFASTYLGGSLIILLTQVRAQQAEGTTPYDIYRMVFPYGITVGHMGCQRRRCHTPWTDCENLIPALHKQFT